jgi:Zn-dependent protease/CBS domain-containing protein
MFGRRFTLFKLLGFQVQVDASWLFIAGLVTWSLAGGLFPAGYPGLATSTYWLMGIIGAVLLFGSIVVHELFHSLVARRYDIPMKGITLFIFGGVADMEREPATPKAEFLMAAAGPAASIVIGFIFYILHAAVRNIWPAPVIGVVAYLWWVNWVLAAFNLIPAFPLDGGRIMRSALWQWKGDLLSATRIASRVGSGFAMALMVLAVLRLFTGDLFTAVWWFLIGSFLGRLAKASYTQVLVKSTLSGQPIQRFMNESPDSVTPATSVEELVDEHIYKHHERLVPVIQGSDELAGCVTTEQVRTLPRGEWRQHTVQEIIKPCSAENTISPVTDAVEALQIMNRTNSTRLMVVDNGRLVGTVALKDLMEFLSTKLELEGEKPPRAA